MAKSVIDAQRGAMDFASCELQMASAFSASGLSRIAKKQSAAKAGSREWLEIDWQEGDAVLDFQDLA